MNTRVEFSDCRNALPSKVGSAILGKGFALASCTGLDLNTSISINLPNTDCVGILYKDPEAQPSKHLFGLITQEPLRAFIGTVWFKNRTGANDKNWVIEAYGRKYLELVKNLAEELATTFNVTVDLRLTTEKSETESCMSNA